MQGPTLERNVECLSTPVALLYRASHIILGYLTKDPKAVGDIDRGL